MRIAEKFSNIYAEEFLIVHHRKDYNDLLSIIESVEAPVLNQDASKLKHAFSKKLYASGWRKVRKPFYVSTSHNVTRMLESLEYNDQKEFLKAANLPLYPSFNQMDFVKNKIAVEVQLGKYFAVTYDLFVKHLSFYTGQIIDVGIEIVPMKSMQKDMSSGPPWFEKEVHNVLRHGRTNPPVPLLIIGIEP